MGTESNWKSLKIVLCERMTVCERVGGYAWFKTSTTFVMFACRKICRDFTAPSLLEVGVFCTCTLSTLQRNYHRLEVSNVPLVCEKNGIISSKDVKPYVTLLNFLARGFCLVLRSVRALGWERLHCTVGYLMFCQFLLWALQDTGFDKALWHEESPVAGQLIVPLVDKVKKNKKKPSGRVLKFDQLQNRKL